MYLHIYSYAMMVMDEHRKAIPENRKDHPEKKEEKIRSIERSFTLSYFPAAHLRGASQLCAVVYFFCVITKKQLGGK